MTHKSVDVIEAVEAIYALHGAEAQWLQGICEAVAPWYAEGLGTIAWTFGMGAAGPWVGEPVVVGGDPSYRVLPRRYLSEFGADDSRVAYASGPCATGQASYPDGGFQRLCPPGVEDFLGTIGMSPEGLGIMVGAPSARTIQVRRQVRYRADRLASHLASAFRLRHRVATGALASLGADAADAVLAPGGALVHAEGADAKGAGVQQALRRAVGVIDRARARRLDADEALDTWRALVSGRWSLVDHYESDGRRYVVALRNPPGVTDPRALTVRERQVAAYAALGYSGRQIGYTLGVDPSAVSRHLGSASRKLGLASPAQLPACFARLLAAGAPAAAVAP